MITDELLAQLKKIVGYEKLTREEYIPKRTKVRLSDSVIVEIPTVKECTWRIKHRKKLGHDWQPKKWFFRIELRLPKARYYDGFPLFEDLKKLFGK